MGVNLAQRIVMLHIAVNRLETKNLRLWVGGTFIAISEKMAKVATCVGSVTLYMV